LVRVAEAEDPVFEGASRTAGAQATMVVVAAIEVAATARPAAAKERPLAQGFCEACLAADSTLASARHAVEVSDLTRDAL